MGAPQRPLAGRFLRGLFASLPALLLGLLSGPLAAQDGAARQAPGQSPPAGVLERRVVVDGAVNPERIPDALAITALLRLWALPPEADAAAEQRFRLVTARLALRPADDQLLRRELQRVHAHLAQRRGPGPPPDAATRHEAQQRAQAAAGETYGRLLDVLSADGRGKVHAALEQAKRNMRIEAVEPRRDR